VATIASGQKGLEEFFRSDCEVAQTLPDRLGFAANIGRALGQVFERWDGRGWPRGIGGEELTLSARIIQVAQDAVVFYRLGGIEAAVAVERERAGTIQDPAIAGRFRRNAPMLLKRLETRSVREAVLEAEPGVRPLLSEARLETALRAIADFVDLKPPYTAGHSSGLPDPDVTSVRRAGFLHDLGRTGVPNGIWEKAGPLTEGEWERVRLHPYLTERILAHPAALARLGSLATLHHERLDGSGYHRGLSAPMQPLPARILAAADSYHAMTEPRPYRAARSSESAAEELRREVRAGRLDGEAAEAVLWSTGRRPRRREWPAGLST
jgi:HD-GYP domain-containing protein (c-di-GMP phosphodiesterase class II)